MSTTIPFAMHPKLLRDVIERQAGSVWKAVLEGVMNSIEAGASRVDIAVEPLHLRIVDDGQGFQTREQLERCFATFGQPHEASENKRWGEFRMGRGQMFAHGRNVWRSGPFRMTVDIAQNLGFQLDDDLPNQGGCSIDVALRDGLSDAAIHDLQREIARAVLYVSVPVLVNGVQVNKPPEGQSWDDDSIPQAYIRLRQGGSGIDVYNLGVYVQNIPAYRHGLSGVVVSRERLQVNFARNDVMASCPVWKRIRTVIESHATVKREAATRLQTRLSDEQRLAAVQRLVAGELTIDEFTKLRLLVDIHGEGISSVMIRRASFTGWTFATAGDPRADHLSQERRILVLDRACLDGFGVEPEAVLGQRWTLHDRTWNLFSPIPFVPFEVAAAHLVGDHSILPESAYQPRERAWLRVLEWATRHAILHLRDRPQPGRQHGVDQTRRLCIGLSAASNAWTDGSSYIAISRQNIPLTAPIAVRGRIHAQELGSLLGLLAHEYAHDALSITDGHDRHFYRRFHDLVRSGFITEPLTKALAHFTPVRLKQVMTAEGDAEDTPTTAPHASPEAA